MLLNLMKKVSTVIIEGKALMYIKWILKYTLKGNWRLGTEMGYWEEELKNKRPEGWIEPMHEDIEPTIERLKERFGEKIQVLELGPGPKSRLTEGYRKELFDLVAVDPLADEYKKHLGGEHFLVKGHGETVDILFPPNTFHMSYASNSLDHSSNPLKCFRNMVSLTKVGGYIMVQGNVNEGERTNWLGLHKYNMWIDEDRLMYCTKHGAPVNLAENMGLKKVAGRTMPLEGSPWFSTTYEKVLGRVTPSGCKVLSKT